MHEIANHPWLKVSVPIYAHMPNAIVMEHEEQFEIDEEVYAQVKSMGFPI